MKFYVFNRFLTSSPDWELWCLFVVRLPHRLQPIAWHRSVHLMSIRPAAHYPSPTHSPTYSPTLQLLPRGPSIRLSFGLVSGHEYHWQGALGMVLIDVVELVVSKSQGESGGERKQGWYKYSQEYNFWEGVQGDGTGYSVA